jgi:hypothetical protein
MCTDCALHLQTAPRLTLFCRSRDVLEPAKDLHQNAQVRLTIGVVSVTAVYVGQHDFPAALTPCDTLLRKLLFELLQRYKNAFTFETYRSSATSTRLVKLKKLQKLNLTQIQKIRYIFTITQQKSQHANDEVMIITLMRKS